MNRIFHDVLNKFVLVFVDDILVFSKTKEEHESHLKSILETLRNHQLKAKFSKCHFWKDEVRYLGHIVSSNGVSVDPVKIAAINVSLSFFSFSTILIILFFLLFLFSPDFIPGLGNSKDSI